MSKSRGLFPMALATVVGIATGKAIFDPAFKEDKELKEKEGSVTSYGDLNDRILTPP